MNIIVANKSIDELDFQLLTNFFIAHESID